MKIVRFLSVIWVILSAAPIYALPGSVQNYRENLYGNGPVQEKERITLHLKNIPIGTFFEEVHKQTNLDFVYNTEQLRTMPTISVNAENELIYDVLERVFLNTDFSYRKTGNIISIVRRVESSSDKTKSGRPFVKGKVVDDAGEPLVGVNVQVKNTSDGAFTDVDGNFSILVANPRATVLTFSYVGMKKKEISLKGRKVVNVTMEQDAVAVDDVVIVGAYGTAQKRSDQVGSAFQVNSDQLKFMPQVRADKLLDGLVPGVKIEPNTDSPDNTRVRYNIRVRGDASLAASNEPLWVIDGTPVYTGGHTNLMPGMNTSVSPLSFLNPDDIESMTVLKDATATSLFGANGANGVILVTTKKGAIGKTRINLSLQYGVAQIDKSTAPKVLNASQYMELAKESFVNAGNDLRYFPYTDNELNSYSTTNTDWMDQFYDLGNTLNAGLTFSGGTNTSKYYVSGSYFENNATIKGNKQQRFSLYSNTEFKFGSKLTASFQLSSSYNVNDIFNPGTDYYDFLPIVNPYNADGTFRLYNRTISGKASNGEPVWTDSHFFNSIAEREENLNQQKTLYNNANVKLAYDVIKGLTYTVQAGVEYQSSREETYSARTNWSGIISGEPMGEATRNSLNLLNWTVINRLNYNRTFGKHTVGGLLGLEANSKDYTTIGVSGYGFINDEIQDVSYAETRNASNSSSESKSVSMLAQLSYSYDRRYYLTLNGRRDGNSQFGSDARWANFASAGISWNIHNEKFFHIPFMNVLKIKASYGANGNSRLGSQEALGLYTYGESYNYAGESGGVMSGAPNSKLSWETTYMTNWGVRMRFLDRFDIEVEGYRNKTKNLLSQLDVSRTTGDTRVYRNVGSILNKGWEITISSENLKPRKNGGLRWITELNMAHNSNKLLEIYNGIQKNMGNYVWKEEYDIHTFNLVRWAGVDPRDGAPLWYDAEGNITRVYSTNNRVPGKKSTPFVTGGMTNTLAYKDFSLRVLLNYTIGGYAYSSFGRGNNSDGLNIMSTNQSVDQLDRWQNPGDLALNPKPIWGVSTQSVMGSTRYLYKRTNVRLQNVVLSYQLPSDFIHKAGINSCIVSLVGDNLLVWSPYSSKNHNSYKTSMSGYPLERVVTLSLNVGF